MLQEMWVSWSGNWCFFVAFVPIRKLVSYLIAIFETSFNALPRRTTRGNLKNDEWLDCLYAKRSVMLPCEKLPRECGGSDSGCQDDNRCPSGTCRSSSRSAHCRQKSARRFVRSHPYHQEPFARFSVSSLRYAQALYRKRTSSFFMLTNRHPTEADRLHSHP